MGLRGGRERRVKFGWPRRRGEGRQGRLDRIGGGGEGVKDPREIRSAWIGRKRRGGCL